jgi:hypothetical protein
MKVGIAFAIAALAGNFDALAAPSLVAYRATYDVTLDHTTGSDFLAARGRMAIQVKNTCDGWSTVQRLVADMTDVNGALSRTDYFVTTWESKDGRIMRFDLSNTLDGKAVERRRGSAKLEADGSGRVTFADGHAQGFALPKGTEFPSSQILDIVRTAQEGGTSYKHVVFQGGDKDNLNLATAVIGRSAGRDKLSADRATDRRRLLRGLPAWPALISFFPLSTRAEQADYEIETHLFANGINGSMMLIYPTYRLKATLTRLEALYPSC